MTEHREPTSVDEDSFMAYLDGEMSPQDAARFEERLQQDEELSTAFHRYRRTMELLRAAGTASAPDDLLPAMERRVSRRMRMSDVPIQIRFPYELLVFLVLMVGMLSLYFLAAPPKVDQLTVLVRVELVQPPPTEIINRFDLHDAGVGDADTHVATTRLSQAQTRALLEAVTPILAQPVALPPQGDFYRLVLAWPLDS